MHRFQIFTLGRMTLQDIDGVGAWEGNARNGNDASFIRCSIDKALLEAWLRLIPIMGELDLPLLACHKKKQDLVIEVVNLFTYFDRCGECEGARPAKDIVVDLKCEGIDADLGDDNKVVIEIGLDWSARDALDTFLFVEKVMKKRS